MVGDRRVTPERGEPEDDFALIPGGPALVLLGISFITGALALALNYRFPEPPSTAEVSLGWSGWTRLGLVVVGAMCGGIALKLELGKFKGKGWPQFPESVVPALICIFLAVFMVVSSFALKGEPGAEEIVSNDNTGQVLTWHRPGQMQSLAMVCVAGAVVALVSGFLLVVPEVVRRVALVGFVGFHFCGILTAVLSVPPPGGSSPWLVSRAWTYVYRPYLFFIYQNNAYHFYSPEPGPPSLLWLQLTYTDGGKRWFKLPDQETSPTPMHFQRMLSIGESTAQVMQRDPGPFRSEAALQKMATLLGLERLPRGTIAPLTWRQPQPNSKHMICSYVRSLMNRFPHPDGNPEAKVMEGHLWRVVHTIIQPGEIAYKNLDPTDRRFYVTVYQGEFDENGNLRDPNDPLLYWMIQAYDREAIQQLVVEATERESELRRLRDMRGRDKASAADIAVMKEEADSLHRFQGMLEIWLRQENPVIDFFKLQSESKSFPPVSVWAGEDDKPTLAPAKLGDGEKNSKAGVVKPQTGIRGAGEVKP